MKDGSKGGHRIPYDSGFMVLVRPHSGVISVGHRRNTDSSCYGFPVDLLSEAEELYLEVQRTSNCLEN